MEVQYIKENVRVTERQVGLGWAVAAICATVAALFVAAAVDRSLPEPLRRGAPPHRFIAEIAHEHLVNLTSIGPRVAGSYENEVVAMGMVVEAIRRIARSAGPHNVVEIDVHTASGAFPLTFLDGMTNVYHNVSSVVARVRGAGGPPPPPHRRSALLFNCHIDTVPDSPGASDDGAGCAVLLETMRALAGARSPLRHDAVFLLNGAEENIMQASHAFVTQHAWARAVRAFVNIEACGAGEREVLFQAGPHDPWLVEVYAAVVPHPFASSLAQELFESGLIPADTDFRVFRDFGGLSGLDLAWSSNGYVYHTQLDTAARVSAAALQRTGDNVAALAHGLLASPRLELAAERSARPPVFFDVLGLWVVCARPPAAAAAALAALALAALHLLVSARRARKHLSMPSGRWMSGVGRTALRRAGGAAGGVAAAAAVGALLHAAGARLTFYSRPWLLAPLYAAPALATSWWWERRGARGGGVGLAQRHADAGVLVAGGALAACGAARLRSGFVPLVWCAPAALAELAGGRWGVRAAAAAPAVLHTAYLAVGALNTLVPVVGRAGAGPVPPDAVLAALVAALALLLASWMSPLLILVRRSHLLVWFAAGVCAVTCAVVCCERGEAAYSADTPQRLMVFHTRRTRHAPADAGSGDGLTDTFYWVPALDANTARTVASLPPLAAAGPVTPADCARTLYCGVPYYLPALSLIGQSLLAPTEDSPLPRLHVRADVNRLNGTALGLTLELRAEGAAHAVVVVSPAAGARLAWPAAGFVPQEARPWAGRRVYFFALHEARAGPGGEARWRLPLVVEHAEDARPPGGWAEVSAAAHALAGAAAKAPAHAALLAAVPPWVAPTGWGVDLHLLSL